MPSDQSTWLISVPKDGDAEGLFQEVSTKLVHSKALSTANIAELDVPVLKVGTLDLLVTLSEELPKHDSVFTSTVAKIVDTLRNLLNNDPGRLAQHTLVEERGVDDYLLRNWKWNSSKYGLQRNLRDIVDTLVKEMNSIDGTMKAKLNSYNLAKGALTQLQRKTTGNLSTRSLVGTISKDKVTDSEYLDTLFVAVPKNNINDWLTKYERLAPMVVPRSTEQIAADDEYALFRVVVFKKTRDQFVQKCRENRFIVREFTWEDDQVEKQDGEIETAQTTEKELWTELLRIARTNFSEAFQALTHLKVVRLFVESVLRYGLPANFTGLVIKPDTKASKRILSALTSHFSYLSPRSKDKSKTKGSAAEGEIQGEYASLMEAEFFDFVLFEVPWVT